MLQCMLDYLDTWLSKSIGLWVVWNGGFMGETPFNVAICKGSTSILWAIICVKDFWCVMITKPFLQDVGDFDRVTLACREAVYQDYLGIEISKDEVIHTIQIEMSDAYICQGV